MQYINSIAFLWRPILEISILWFLIYRIMLFFENSRAKQVIRGIIVLLVAFFLFQKLRFEILDWLLSKILSISVIAVLIIFQPEIRQGLARLGQRHLFTSALREEELDHVLAQISKACDNLCKEKVGALIAIQKNDPLNAYNESGVIIDAWVSAELIQNIFTPNSLLHDGGMIIQNNRISAAGCLFPLTQDQDLSRVFGTRHRAALGLTEEADAVVIVVSEERQDVSFAYQGKLYKGLSREELIDKVKEIIKLKKIASR